VTTTRVLCLCCGTSYDAAGDCPNVERWEHSIELAFAVAMHLRERGIERPTPTDVAMTVALLALDELRHFDDDG
jgi:hypothetical protein